MTANRITLETEWVKVTVEFDELSPKAREVIAELALLLDLPDPPEPGDEDPSEELEDYEDDDDGLRDEARAAAADREFIGRLRGDRG